MTPPHPSPAGPQLTPRSAHVFGTQFVAVVGFTHLLGAFGPPHRWPAGHDPQSGITPPQPSPDGPHSIPCSLHVCGLQPFTPLPCSPKLPGGGCADPTAVAPPPNSELPSLVPHATTISVVTARRKMV